MSRSTSSPNQSKTVTSTASPVSAALPALDKDIDEELLLDVPPPPPRHRQPISPMHQNSHHGGMLATTIGQHPHHLSHSYSSKNPLSSQNVTTRTPSSNSASSSKKNTNIIINKNGKKTKASRIESFHNAILTNMAETEQLRRQHQQQRNNKLHVAGSQSTGSADASVSGTSGRIPTAVNDPSSTSLLSETIRDISTAAASTMETLKSALEQAKSHQQQQKQRTEGDPSSFRPPNCVSCVRTNTRAVHATPATGADTPADLTGLLSKWCGIQQPAGNGNDDALPSDAAAAAWEPHMKKMQDAVQKMVVSVNHNNNKSQQSSTPSSSWQQATQDIWRFASGGPPTPCNHPSSKMGRSRTTAGHYDDDEDDRGMASPNHWANLLGLGNTRGHEEDDQNTVGTYDTWHDENSQLRRLGSWGTVGSGFTSGTGGTFGTYDIGGSPASSVEDIDTMRLVLEDDHGNAIDPVLLEKTQKMKQQQRLQQQQQQHQQQEATTSSNNKTNVARNKDGRKVKRKKRRAKVVQFDYPPIKSLRQYIRPDPEDLPNLFFTEQELDQIEEDRYCTMSTDDIEIVAVSSKLSSSSDDENENDNKTPKSTTIGGGTNNNKETSVEKRDSPSPSEPNEHGLKSAKGRSGTPHRRRQASSSELSSELDVDVDKSKRSSSGGGGAKSPSCKSPRLVKGVQIYLRERSTGA
ncbi:hypothetical protein IV203_030354 [Nitzschia inconspicua]|uniref:Uncharacterized protein n=1 Tax=Nitzschia inconspicua TaxID=303405 RepID=A0A9K3LTE4_9STRA|nr:hypothetical protein IV203_030354 [Nitzschia inconspicua]